MRVEPRTPCTSPSGTLGEIAYLRHYKLLSNGTVQALICANLVDDHCLPTVLKRAVNLPFKWENSPADLIQLGTIGRFRNTWQLILVQEGVGLGKCSKTHSAIIVSSSPASRVICTSGIRREVAWFSGAIRAHTASISVSVSAAESPYSRVYSYGYGYVNDQILL